MRGVLRRLAGKLWLMVATLVILVAVATVTARQLLPTVPHYRVEIEHAASQALGHPVRIGQIQVGWHWFSPQVRLRDVSVLQSPHGPALLRLARVAVGLNVPRSLLELRPVPSVVRLSGVHLKLSRDKSGRVSLSGLPLALPAAGSGGGLGAVPGWLAGVTVELDDASVLLTDARTGLDYRLSHLSLAAQVGGAGTVHVAGGARLPAQVGQSLEFVAELHDVAAPQGRWSGRVYVDLAGGRLGSSLLRELLPNLPVMRGTLSAQLWSHWKDGLPESLKGHVGVSDFAFAGPSAAAASAQDARDSLTRLQGDFTWNRTAGGWDLAAGHLQAGNAYRSWPESAFSVAESRAPGGRHFYGWADFLRLQDLAPLVVAQPAVPAVLRQRVAVLAPRGDVSGLRFDIALPHTGAPQVTASARLNGVALNPDGALPGAQGVSGMLRATPTGGALALNSTAFVLDAPKLFDAPPPPAAARGVIHWTLRPDGISISSGVLDLTNTDLSATGQFGLWLPFGGKPYLNALVHLSRARIVTAHKYLPYHLFDAKVGDWLRTGLLGGQVSDASMVMRGDPTQFPFRHHEGVFEARLHVSGGALHYFGNWPRLSGLDGEVLFDGPSLQVQASAGQMLGTHIESARLAIPDMAKARLDIHATAQGPLADVPKFMSYTPVGDGHQALFDEMRTTGRERLSLHLILPFTGGGLKDWQIRGSSMVENGSFALPQQDFALNAINGRVDFTRRSLTANNVAAQFRGQPVRIAATSRGDGLSTLTLDGHYSVAGLLGSTSPVTRFAHGKADLRLAFTLPLTPEAFHRYGMGLALVSDLRDVAVNLPAPLGKKSGQRRALVLRFSITRPQEPVWLRYGTGLQAVFRLAGTGQCHYIAAGDVRYDRGPPNLPSSGINLEATVPSINVDAWRALQSAVLSGAGSGIPGCPDAPADVIGRVRAVNLKVASMRLFGREFRSVSVDARRGRSQWQAKLESNVLGGNLQIPLDLHGGSPLRFDLTHLTLGQAAHGIAPRGAAASLNPASLPALSGTIARLDIAGRRVDGVKIATTPLRDGMQIHQLRIEEPHLQASVSGDWLDVNGSNQTRLHVQIKTDNAGEALRKLNLSNAIGGGSGNVAATLAWPGAPYEASWKTVSGQASLSLSNGSFSQVNPGQAGRLLGLFNLSELPRHLASGFGDLFRKGFAFNTLKGDFQLRGGNLYTQNMQIDGSSANIGLQGRIGMAAQDFDATVTVVPQVDSALPIAGAVVGGPAAGAVVYLLDKVFGIGKRINQAAELKYHVGGSWKDPKIQILKAPQSHSAAPSHDNLFGTP